MQPQPTKQGTPPAKPAGQRPKREPSQNIRAAEISDALLKIQTVVAVTGRSESSIRRKMAAGAFPQPFKDGARCTRWRAGDVTDWLRSKVAAQ